MLLPLFVVPFDIREAETGRGVTPKNDQVE